MLLLSVDAELQEGNAYFKFDQTHTPTRYFLPEFFLFFVFLLFFLFFLSVLYCVCNSVHAW